MPILDMQRICNKNHMSDFLVTWHKYQTLHLPRTVNRPFSRNLGSALDKSWLNEAGWCTYASVKYANIGSDKGLLPDWHQTIIWTNNHLLPSGPSGIKAKVISFKTWKCLFKKIHLKMSSVTWQPFCPSLTVLRYTFYVQHTFPGNDIGNYS